MQLKTKRLLLRPLQAADAESLARLWTDPEVTKFMGGPRDFETVRQTLLADARADPLPEFDLWPVIEQATGRIIGHCGLLDKEVEGVTEIELIYVFAKDVWGKGYATEMAAAVKDYAFSQLGLKRIIALIDPENAASERVAEKVGLHFEKDVVRPEGETRRVYARNRQGPKTDRGPDLKLEIRD
jgi:ribosomal-protein-alanine N-acetyltransferase